MTSLGMSCVKSLQQIWRSSNELQRFDRIVGCACAGNAGIVFPPPRVSDPEMHHGTYVTHVPWCISGLLTSGFLWSRWRGKRSRHSRRMRNPQFYVSGKRPMATRRHAVLDDQSNSLDLEPVNMCTNDQWQPKYQCRLEMSWEANGKYKGTDATITESIYSIRCTSIPLIFCQVNTHTSDWRIRNRNKR